MPELPEVETIVNDLKAHLIGAKLCSFVELNPLPGAKKALTEPARAIFSRRLRGQRIAALYRRAKMLVFEFERDCLVVHLKMTGQLVYRHCGRGDCELVAGGHPIAGVGPELPNRFTRAVFRFDDDSELYFNDVRRFGWLRLYDKPAWRALERSLGLEPLGPDFSLAKFKEMLERKKRSSVKQAILEQKYLVGVGNIYADEALFAAGIRPDRPAAGLTAAEVKLLWQAIPRILKSAIRHRGTSFSDYRDAHGQKGNFVPRLKVYGRAGQPCKACGRPLAKARIGGRGTVWCETCQR